MRCSSQILQLAMRTTRIYQALIMLAFVFVLSVYLHNRAQFVHKNVIFEFKLQPTGKLDADPKDLQLIDQDRSNYDGKSNSDGVNSTSYNKSKVNELPNATAMPGKELIFKSNDSQDTSNVQMDLKSSNAMDRKSGEYTHADMDSSLESTKINGSNPKNLTVRESKLLEVLPSKLQVMVESERNKSIESETIVNLHLKNIDKENDALQKSPKFPTSDIIGVNEDTEDRCNYTSVVTFKPGGRLGNRICEFIHLVDFKEKHSLQAFVHPGMWTTLRDSFPNITLPVLPKNCWKELEKHMVAYGEAVDAPKGNISSRMLLTDSPCSPSAVWSSRNKWRRELAFSRELQENLKARKLKLMKRWQREGARPGEQDESKVPTVIGVHVRRGDYHTLLTQYKFGDLLPPEYYQRAFQFFRERHNFTLFLILTEPSERPWCQQWLTNGTSDVVVVDDSSTPIQDLALLASMEHIIYSHGTFGLTAILLSNIKTLVYPAINTKSKARRYSPYTALDDISKNWAGVNFVTVASTKL